MDSPQGSTPDLQVSPDSPQEKNSPTALEARLQQLEAELAKAQKTIADLNHEAGQKRIRAKEAEQRAIEAEQKRLSEQGEFKTLFEQTRAQLDDLLPFKERYELIEATIKANNEKRIASIPETMRGLVPTGYTPEALAAWLDANQNLLTLPQAPDLDAGRRGTSNTPKLALTPDEKRIAIASGMTEEEYAKYKGK